MGIFTSEVKFRSQKLETRASGPNRQSTVATHAWKGLLQSDALVSSKAEFDCTDPGQAARPARVRKVLNTGVSMTPGCNRVHALLVRRQLAREVLGQRMPPGFRSRIRSRRGRSDRLETNSNLILETHCRSLYAFE